MSKPPTSPLVLRAQGSFFLGGERVERTGVELGRPAFGPGHITINQMYVEYMVPETESPKVPVIMVHGGTLSGQSWKTTPDGRMGWDEYFVRCGHPVYVVDQVSRARSGFDPKVFNNVREGLEPPSAQTAIFRASDELTWKAWRIGPSYGVPFEDTQFPFESAKELSKYNVADLNDMQPSPNPSYEALSELARDLGGAVVFGHSQGGVFPMQAALANPAGIRGLVMIEGGATLTGLSEEQITTLAKIPMLAVYGDHLDADSGVPGFSRRALFDACLDFIDRINAAGGSIQMFHPPSQGIRGNTHMVMFDRNNLDIADFILNWIDNNVEYNVRGDERDRLAARFS
jgi:pimeloyl-ACP methyl ester carboxylesterase